MYTILRGNGAWKGDLYDVWYTTSVQRKKDVNSPVTIEELGQRLDTGEVVQLGLVSVRKYLPEDDILILRTANISAKAMKAYNAMKPDNWR